MTKYFITILLTFNFLASIAQTSIAKGDLKYVITTGVPFMRIATDARSSGMAEVGVSTSADNNSGFHNPAKFAFIENDFGANINFAPWLRQITNDIYLINANAYTKIAPDHVMGLGLRYFTLGEINYTDEVGTSLGSAKPFELALEGQYAFRLTENFSIGTSLRFILSDLSNGSSATTVKIPVGTAFSTDIAMFYSKPLQINSLRESKLNIGMNISNIGSKIQYISSSVPDYIPTNLALGATFEGQIDDYNSFSGTLQLDKLLVPTPTYGINSQGRDTILDLNRNGAPDYKEYNSMSGILTSFADHPEGFGGELSETILHLGAEYAYQKTYFVRLGFFYEPENAGGRNFITAGLGMKYNKLNLDFSYLVPITQQRSPLDNQMRVSLSVNMGENKKSSYY